mgnify:CR=1 FL=1
MLSTPVISDDQIKDFEQNGYLILRQAFDADEMRLIEIWTQEMTALPEETGKHWVFHERSLKGDGADLISRIENIAPFHAGFEELSTVLKHPVGQLLGEEATLFKEKINFKMSGGDGFKPHQDSQAGWDAYADFFISALVSIDDATVENGCLQLVAGHHQRGLFKSWRPLSEDDMAGVPEDMATTAYTRYVLDCGMRGDVLDLMAALVPCVVGYAEIGRALDEDPATRRAGNAYARWIAMYASDDYLRVARDAVDQLDRLAERLGGAGRFATLSRVFTQATRLEVAFWDMGWAAGEG